MTSKLARLALGLGVSLVFSAPAMAGGMHAYGHSTKDVQSAAVPVPAPHPIPVFESNYYLRADFGFGIYQNPSYRFTGTPFGDEIGAPFGHLQSFQNDSFDNAFSFGVGVGYKIGHGWRTDFTAEAFSSHDLNSTGSYQHTATVDTAVYAVDEIVRGEVNDKVSVTTGLFMWNVYRDLEIGFGNRFRPYIGGGLGFAWHDLDRESGATESVCADAACATPNERRSASSNDKSGAVSFAASAMVGSTIQLLEATHLDVNYRYLFVDGVNGASADIYGDTSELNLDALHVHQVRLGLRYDLH